MHGKAAFTQAMEEIGRNHQSEKPLSKTSVSCEAAASVTAHATAHGSIYTTVESDHGWPQLAAAVAATVSAEAAAVCRK